METYLEKKVFVYRKSYAFYSKISTTLLVSKFLFSSSGLSAFAFVPLAGLSLGAALIEILEQCELSEFDVSKRKAEFIKTLNFFPREKYIKQAKLNGYKYM
jgi:hypothetical protein